MVGMTNLTGWISCPFIVRKWRHLKMSKSKQNNVFKIRFCTTRKSQFNQVNRRDNSSKRAPRWNYNYCKWRLICSKVVIKTFCSRGHSFKPWKVTAVFHRWFLKRPIQWQGYGDIKSITELSSFKPYEKRKPIGIKCAIYRGQPVQNVGYLLKEFMYNLK